MILEELRKIDKEIYNISKKIKILPYILPANLFREKKKFFESNFDYNPQFRYRKPKSNTKELKKELNKTRKKLLKSCSKNKAGLTKIFLDKIDEMRKEIELLENIGKKSFTKKSILLYGKPSQKLIKLSSEKLQNLRNGARKKRKNGNKFIGSSIARQKMEKVLAKKNLQWQIKEYKKLASRIAIDPQTKTIKLRKGALFKDGCLKCVIAHEVETHIVRYENAKKLPFKIFRTGTANYLVSEEGLAIYNERRVHRKRGEPYHYQRIYLRTLGASWALKHSFKDVFGKFLSLGLGPEETWEVTVRVKRGLADTSKLGGFTKDYLYLKGFLDIKKFVKNKGHLKDLYSGKISSKEVDLVKIINTNITN